MHYYIPKAASLRKKSNCMLGTHVQEGENQVPHSHLQVNW